jgi:hypothetical protein
MTRKTEQLIHGLPGADIIRDGLRDFSENRHTIPSCLVRMARRRLAKAELMEPSPQHDIDAELDLYQLLFHEGNHAHSRYNSLVRQLVSFEHALDHRLSRVRKRLPEAG